MLPLEHSAILSTIIKLPFVIKTFVLSIFKWPLETGSTVVSKCNTIQQEKKMTGLESILCIDLCALPY